METRHNYQVRAKSTRLRSGVIASDAVPKPICFSAPPEFQGEAGLWTPEHFFVASVVTCYVSTFSAMSDVSKLSFVSLEVDADGVLEKGAEGWRFTEVRLRPTLKIAREEDRERANRLLEKAERSCLVARSISARVTMQSDVSVALDTTVLQTVR
ncbi:MAG TPA: OsmC family protein [Candidatus Baltobacteraceae bacterium]|nr:OsmC family protein [Candidatus Baltobacteraceae bacterium]